MSYDEMQEAGLGIPTEPADLEETKHEVSGMGRLLVYAFCLVCFAAVVVMAL